MNKIKRFLTMLLVLCILTSMAPMGALAAETDSTDPTAAESSDTTAVPEETTGVIVETTVADEETTAAPEETTAAPEETTAAPEETTVAAEETTVAAEETTVADEETTDADGEPVEGDISTFGLAAAIELGNKPADGTVTGQPFDTSVSKNYRIPGLVNHNGMLIASADARWDYEYDGGGMDLVVSRSSNGSTWNYTFAGYLGDNGNVWNKESTTLMDPVIISDGSTLYLLADMFPAGYSISSSSTTNVFSDTNIGFNTDGNLLLSGDNRSTYGYYLAGGKIYAADGTEQSGYTVQGWFDLYRNGAYVTNLFFADSPFQVRAASYICMTTSTDGGQSWSSPVLVNAKPSGVAWMVLGPGSGLVTQDGQLAFTAYDGSKIYLIYGRDGSWNSVTTSAATNESSIIELNDGTIRAFVKRGGSNTIAYVDFTKSGSGYTAGSLVDTGVTNFSQCMVSSVHYSKTYQGKEVVLVCCPSKPGSGDWNGRFNGKIHMFTLDGNNAMALVGSYALNGESEFFAYSNMAEKVDGTIAVLYEDDCIRYNAGNYTGNASHITYTSVNLETALGIKFDEKQAAFDFACSGLQGQVTVGESAGVAHIHVEPTTVDGLDVAYSAYDIHLCTQNIENCTDCSACDKAYTGSAIVTLPLTQALKNSAGVKGFVAEADGTVLSITDVTNDGEYVTFKAPHFSVVGIAELDTGDGITNTVNVDLVIGETSQIYTDDTGNYRDSASIGNDTIATMDVIGIPGVTETTVSTSKATELEDGATYILRVYDTGYALSTNTGRGDWGTRTLAFESNFLSATPEHLWTLEAVDGGYKIKSAQGYLNLGAGNNTAYVATTGEVFTFTYTNTGWTIKNPSNEYINALGGLYFYYSAGGWTGDGTRFDLYKVTIATSASTEVTFTGVSKGATSAIVGSTKYNITVSYQEVALGTYAGSSKTAAVSGTVTQEAIDDFNAAHGATVTLSMADGKLTFTGVAAGSVTAVLGNAEYTVTVYDGVKAGNIADFHNIVGEDTYSDDNANETYRSELNMDGKVIKKLTISAGASFNLDVDVADYDSIEWSGLDPAIATVDAETGAVTAVSAGETMVTATVVKDGIAESIAIPVTVKPSVAEGAADKVPVFFYIEQVDHTTPYYTMFLSEADDNTLEKHYTMVLAAEGEVIWLERPRNSALGWVWAATPDADHALVYMASTGSLAEYYPLKNADGALGVSATGCYTGTQAYNNIVNVGNDAGETNWQTALDGCLAKSIGEPYYCDGAMSNTRWDHDGVPKLISSMTFISDPVPTIEKTVDGVLPTTRLRQDYRRYTEGMVASVGELVYFKITVTLERPTVWANEADGTGAIAYSNSIVSDTILNGAYLYTKELDQDDGTYDGEIAVEYRNQATDITKQLNDEWAADEQTRTIELYLVYEIQEDDIPKFIIDNVADLSTNYKSTYSAGVSAREANATASITVVGRAMDDIVIDFGQKVTITGLTNDYLKGVYTGENAKYAAKYGTVEIVQNDDATYQLTYTPTSILQGPDAVSLYGLGADENGNPVEKIINGFIVYPATSVYYEEGFLFGDKTVGSWDLTNAKKATMVQTYEPLGQSTYNSDGKLTRVSGKQHEYGYDPIYDSSSSNSGGSYAVSTTVGDKTAFTFTGTGFELYANSNSASGYVTVFRQGTLSKIYFIHTKLTDIEGSEIANTTHYNLPIISEKNLPYGTYTVYITHTKEESPIYIDGVRIINTVYDQAEDQSNVYYIDQEDNPVFYELRDHVLDVIGVEDLTESDYISNNDRAGMVSKVADMAGQVYNALEANEAATIINRDETTFTEQQAQKLLDNGPKNELYLYPGQTLVFKVTTNRVMQLGLKTPTGSASFDLTVDDTTKSRTLTSSVDMFYQIAERQITEGGEMTHTVSITVNSGMLSVTDLKICDDPNASFTALTQADIENALLAMYGLNNEAEIPAEPETKPGKPESKPSAPETEPYEPERKTSRSPRLAKLSRPSKPGRNHPYSHIPSHPVKNEEPNDPVAVLNVVYMDLRGTQVGSATLREKGNTTDRCVFSASEISMNAPARFHAVRFFPAVVPCGSTATIVVIVI